MHQFNYKDIANYLLKYSVNIISKLDKNTLFENINTLFSFFLITCRPWAT